MSGIRFIILVVLCATSFCAYGQRISGRVSDGVTGEALIGASIFVQSSSRGTITDFDGFYELTLEVLPSTVVISYLGYETEEIIIDKAGEWNVKLKTAQGTVLSEVKVKGQRVSEKQRSAPLTVESMDLLAIKETPSDNFYDGLGNLKGVDLTAASLGFKVINTRGFNSTSPVRSLQIIDGIDNQSPGLNFSLGNFLGAPELDVLKVDLIQGASSAFYGPNAFNGVIAISSKNPFFHEGLSASVKVGERNLLEGAVRWAEVVDNKEGLPVFGYKVNVSYFTADDWEADNYSPIDGSDFDETNPGGYDAVNIYGDEFSPSGDFSSAAPWTFQGLGTFFRTGYRESELVSYDTDNAKANLGFYFRLNPAQKEQATQLMLGTSFAQGSTIYQGDNRFALRDIQFFQHKFELSKPDRFFLRGYMTHEDAGDSYDPYFTALRLQEEVGNDAVWSQDYQTYWSNNQVRKVIEAGYPQLDFNAEPRFDFQAAEEWLANNADLLRQLHQEARLFADEKRSTSLGAPFLAPGTDRFQEAFDRITSSRRDERGTKFIDKSALYHLHGEYKLSGLGIDEVILGSSARYYTPNSEGTIFSDTAGRTITNFEYGMYTGLNHSISDGKVRLSGSLRMDKNENFDFVFSPAASVVYKPAANNFLRLSYSSAIRNPTLSDQYLLLDVGPALLLGNLEGAKGLASIESLENYFSSNDLADIQYFDVDPIQPEKVRTYELGYRTTLWNSLYVDAGYYYSIYQDFIGFNIGSVLTFSPTVGNITGVDVRRYSANSQNEVRTQGFSIAGNYYFWNNFALNANYSWNKLVKTAEDDPIIPAFNTPEHKYNIGVSGRNFLMGGGDKLGFNINYKWIEGFVFEGSPQFTGFVPTYDLLDAQVNYRVEKIHTTFKAGASNLFDRKNIQTYGGPSVGRLAYISATYEF